MKVVFLDRDGIVNMERGDYTFLPEDFVYTPQFWEACQQISKLGYQLILITNQGGIAKKRYTKAHVYALNKKIKNDAVAHGVEILDIYFCPHHNAIEKCFCRKPDSLMLEKACAKYKVDKTKSYFVGDSKRDVEAAKKADIKDVLLTPNIGLKTFVENELNG